MPSVARYHHGQVLVRRGGQVRLKVIEPAPGGNVRQTVVWDMGNRRRRLLATSVLDEEYMPDPKQEGHRP